MASASVASWGGVKRKLGEVSEAVVAAAVAVFAGGGKEKKYWLPATWALNTFKRGSWSTKSWSREHRRAGEEDEAVKQPV